jgi:threonine/homoserine/homoserine lactone efflux protein
MRPRRARGARYDNGAVSEFVAFLGVSAIVIATPGQDTALTIRNTLAGGRRAGIFTAVGVAAGQAVWTVAASAGLAALLVASEPAFRALRLVGAAYLVYLGGQALVSAFRPTGADPRGRAAPPLRAGAALRHGMLSNLGNPKMAVFFTSLLPQFVPGGDASFVALLGLGLLFCALTLGWLSLYAAAVARVGDVLRRPPIRRALDAVTGLVLVALGLRVATERR